MNNEDPSENPDMTLSNSETASEVESSVPPIATTFSEIISDEKMLAALAGNGFQVPTPVQARTIPIALQGKDAVVQAQTGSGKTLAFVLPVLLRLQEAEREGVLGDTFAIMISPTRELAQQIVNVISSVSNIPVACVIGGVDTGGQIQALNRDPRIVVGTPGRILDLMRQKALRLNRCRFFVLDEADEMLSMGFLEDVRAILSRLPDNAQGLFVSATITPRVEMLASSFLSLPENIVVDRPDRDFPPIEHFYTEVGGDLLAKPSALCDLIETFRPGSTIIFCNTKSDTQLVEARLRRRGFNARRLNSDLTQAQRTRVMNKIRDREIQILVATDIAARGLDLEKIDLVINYSIHDQPETYVHRTGRTGRAGRSGRAISLVGPKDFGAFHFLQKVVGLNFQKMPLPSEEELADARLAHLYEIVRKSHIEPRERDLLLARKLLLEMGGISEPSEEFETLTAKLGIYLFEHHILQEANSLDEELGVGRPETRSEGDQSEEGSSEERYGRGRERRPRDEGRGGSRSRGRGRDDRGRGGDRNRGDRDHGGRDRRDGPRDAQSGEARYEGQRPEEDRHERHDKRSDSSRERYDDTRRTDAPRGNRADYNDRSGGRSRDRDHRSRNRGDSRGESQERETANDEVRLYIGQGRSQGMTPEVFSGLANQFAELSPEDLHRISLRDRYGFVDVSRPNAKKLIDNLNGFEYNGSELVVEVATVFKSPRERSSERAQRTEPHRRSNQRDA